MIEYKYNEDNLLNELKEYVDNTYGEHYSFNKFQVKIIFYANDSTIVPKIKNLIGTAVI